VLDLLREFPHVVEAAVVYGETDIITKIEAPTQAALDEVIMGRIQGIPAVESTRTFLVVGGLAWERPDPPE
jgi:DNA-binding Lrp family transcriptional regulator